MKSVERQSERLDLEKKKRFIARLAANWKGAVRGGANEPAPVYVEGFGSLLPDVVEGP